MTEEKMVLRLSADTLAVYRALVAEGEFVSLSEAVRKVLDSYAEGRVANGVAPLYDVEEVVDIADLTPDGRGLDDMVRAAADRYLRDRASSGERLGRCGPPRMRRCGEIADARSSDLASPHGRVRFGRRSHGRGSHAFRR